MDRLQAIPSAKEKKFFLSRRGHHYFLLSLARIVYFTRDKGVVHAIDRDQVPHPVEGQLVHLEALLPARLFMRINRVHIINKDFTHSFKPAGKGKLEILLKTPYKSLQMVTSSTRTAAVKQWLAQY